MSTKPKYQLIGMRFGHWTVKDGSHGYWLCVCDCGTERRMQSSNLIDGRSTSCGCARIDNLAGKRFGRWTVIEYSHRSPVTKRVLWSCRCDCGTVKAVTVLSLKNGMSRSCGCLASDVARERNYKHGLNSHPLRSVYQGMKQRCLNPKAPEYENYGSRGIAVRPCWQESFVNFLADMGERPPQTTLERIDNDGPYSPDNCRWATIKEQCNNTRQNRILEYDGKRLTLTAWAELLNIKPNTLRSRLRTGWTVEATLTTPVKT